MKTKRRNLWDYLGTFSFSDKIIALNTHKNVLKQYANASHENTVNINAKFKILAPKEFELFKESQHNNLGYSANFSWDEIEKNEISFHHDREGNFISDIEGSLRELIDSQIPHVITEDENIAWHNALEELLYMPRESVAKRKNESFDFWRMFGIET